METLDVNCNDIRRVCLTNSSAGLGCNNRPRRISLDHGQRGTYLDGNGNSRRRSSVCLATPSLTNVHKAVHKARTLPNRRASEVTDLSMQLESCLLKQVQGLMGSRKLSVALVDELRNEINNLSVREDSSQWLTQRRQSRRGSVASTNDFTSTTCNDDNQSTEEHGNHATNDIAVRSAKRRQSYANIEHFARMPASRTRSHSIVHGHSDHMQHLSECRRLKATQGLHVAERRGSCTRRASYVITRVTSVQKRLYNIYRRRRRKEHRRCLEKEDITVALNAQVNHNCQDGHAHDESESEHAANGESDLERGNGIAVCNGNIELSAPVDTDSSVEQENGNLHMDCPVSVDDHPPPHEPRPESVDDPPPTHELRRRCSIQARSWEISRRLRQRRREKRMELKITTI